MKNGKRAKQEKEEKNKIELKNLNFKILWIVLVILVVVTAIIIYSITNTQEYADKKMTKLVTKYYENNIKENAIGVNRLIVTLQTLKDAGFNIKGIKGKPGVVEDLSKAFSYVIVENPEETNPVYTVENHLNGI